MEENRLVHWQKQRYAVVHSGIVMGDGCTVMWGERYAVVHSGI